jgi:hypothetical protein
MTDFQITKERHNHNEVDFPKEKRSQNGGLYTTKETQPNMADFQLNKRDSASNGGLEKQRRNQRCI